MAMAARMPMMATTIMSSMRVKPRCPPRAFRFLYQKLNMVLWTPFLCIWADPSTPEWRPADHERCRESATRRQAKKRPSADSRAEFPKLDEDVMGSKLRSFKDFFVEWESGGTQGNRVPG